MPQMQPQNPAASRREFLRASVRYGWLFALGGALAWISSRPHPPQSCPADNLCVGCPVFTQCTLPSKTLTNASDAPSQPVPAHGP